MGNPLTSVEKYISEVVHRTRVAVEAAVAQAEEIAARDKAKLAEDARAAVKAVVDAAKADAPEIEAAIKKGAADALTALEAVLAARGL